MRTTMVFGRAVVAAAVLVAAAGCGGDDEGGGDDGAAGDEVPADTSSDTTAEAADEGSDEQQAYVEAMVEASGMTAEGTGQTSPEQAECVWTSFLDIVGVEELAAVATVEEVRNDELDAATLRGITGGGEDFPAQWVDAMAECTDVRELALLIVRDDETFPAESEDCLRENIDEEFARGMLVVGFSQFVAEEPPEVPAELTAQGRELEATCGAG
jgi:hypothetical protein